MQFSDIKGLDEVKQHLINSVNNNHLAHAQLFVGQEGGANLAMAWAFAAYLNCEDRQERDSCGKCPACIKTGKLVHPDLHFVYPVSATKKISGKDLVSTSFIAEWRDFLKSNPYGLVADWSNFYGGENKQGNISKQESREIIKNLSLKAFEGKYKIMIIWMPEYLHPSAANGILKVLEEPPENTIFLLVANDMEKLLVTILSRTQKVNIRAFSDDEVEAYLVEKHQMDVHKASQVAQMADGNLNEAERLLDQVEDDNGKMFREWMRFCFTWDLTKMVEWADQYQKMNKVAQKTLLQYTLSMMRETLIFDYSPGNLQRLQGEELAFVKNFSKVMTAEKVEMLTEKVNEAYYHLERNANAKILFTDLSLVIAKILRA